MAQCSLCGQRKAKRYCTSIGEDICPQCCATSRETTLNCPFECSYLRESRRHEKRDLDPARMPYADISVDAEFLRRSDMVLMLLSMFLNEALRPSPSATDQDARDVLDAEVASWRLADAGAPEVVVPENPTAAEIQTRLRTRLSGFVDALQERDAGPFANRVFLGVSVFLARVAYGYDNGRPRCRAFIHYLRETCPEPSTGAEGETAGDPVAAADSPE